MQEENRDMISEANTNKKKRNAFDMKPNINVNFEEKFEAIDKCYNPYSILSMISD